LILYFIEKLVIVRSDFIRTILLPPASLSSSTFEGELATASGFGKTSDSETFLFKIKNG
jgi:hypothetical protein